MQNLRKLFNRKYRKSNKESLEIPSTSIHKTSKGITVHVICPNTQIMNFYVDVKKTLAQLKDEVVLRISNDPTCLPAYAKYIRDLGPHFRMYRAEYDSNDLDEKDTIENLNIKESDTFIISLRRHYLQNLATQYNLPCPTDLEILSATKNLPGDYDEKPIIMLNEIYQKPNMKFAVRKILISLAHSSAAVIGVGPYARCIIEMLKQKLINKREPSIDTLKWLTDMDFKSEHAEYAIKMANNCYSLALEWLLQTHNDLNLKESMQKNVKLTTFSKNSPIQNLKVLRELVRICSKRELLPSVDTIKSIVEMGFEENEIVKALQNTCNDKAAAVEWLCGYRTESLIELTDGLSKETQIFKDILAMPQVQINLSNPKILLALLAILENEKALRLWGADNDTKNVLESIMGKFYEEKHKTCMNQYYPQF